MLGSRGGRGRRCPVGSRPGRRLTRPRVSAQHAGSSRTTGLRRRLGARTQQRGGGSAGRVSDDLQDAGIGGCHLSSNSPTMGEGR
jgi:hypothetical protein